MGKLQAEMKIVEELEAKLAEAQGRADKCRAEV